MILASCSSNIYGLVFVVGKGNSFQVYNVSKDNYLRWANVSRLPLVRNMSIAELDNCFAISIIAESCVIYAKMSTRGEIETIIELNLKNVLSDTSALCFVPSLESIICVFESKIMLYNTITQTTQDLNMMIKIDKGIFQSRKDKYIPLSVSNISMKSCHLLIITQSKLIYLLYIAIFCLITTLFIIHC